MISNKKAVDAANVIKQYCDEQQVCQNCIFRAFGAEHWNCLIYALDIKDVLANIKAKKFNKGYL